jgi:hypothetical protein
MSKGVVWKALTGVARGRRREPVGGAKGAVY